MPGVAKPKEGEVRHARLELPVSVHERLKSNADRFLLSQSAYLRAALIEKLERDEKR